MRERVNMVGVAGPIDHGLHGGASRYGGDLVNKSLTRVQPIRVSQDRFERSLDLAERRAGIVADGLGLEGEEDVRLQEVRDHIFDAEYAELMVMEKSVLTKLYYDRDIEP